MSATRKPEIQVTPRLLSKKQAADRLGISTSSLDRLVIMGKIKCVFVPGTGTRPRRMFDIAELDRFIEANSKMLAD